MQFLNHTPFSALGWVSTDPQEHLYVTVVASVKFIFDTLDEDGVWHFKLHQDQEGLCYGDKFYNLEKRWVRREGEVIPHKRQADLLMNLSSEVSHLGRCGVDVIRYHSPTDKSKLLSHRSTKNLGVVHRAEPSRMQYIGTLDKEWEEAKGTKYPRDFDERHYNAAHEKLQLISTYFQPGDMIVLDKFLPGIHKQTIIMPGIYLKASNLENGKTHTELLEADTVFFDVEALDMQKNALYISYRKRILTSQNPREVHLNMLLEEAFIEPRSA